jgi:hypothetical protein
LRSGFAVVGYCGLGLSVLGVFASLIMIYSGIDRLRSMLEEEMAAPRLEVLRVAGVPPSIVQRVADAAELTSADLAALTDRQLRLTVDAQQHLEAGRAAAADAADASRRNTTVIAVCCAVMGLLSLVLVLTTGTARDRSGRTRAARPRNARRT